MCFCGWVLLVGQRGVGVRHYNWWKRLQLRLDNIGDCSEEDHALSSHGTAGYLIWLNGPLVFSQLYRFNRKWLFDTQAITSSEILTLRKERFKKKMTEGGYSKGWVMVMVRCPSTCLSRCHVILFERLSHVWWARATQGLSSGFCWVSVKLLIGSVLTMDRGCCKWSRDIIQALIGAQLVGMCLSEHIFTSEFTTQTPRPDTDAARRGGIEQAGLHLRSRDKQNSVWVSGSVALITIPFTIFTDDLISWFFL